MSRLIDASSSYFNLLIFCKKNKNYLIPKGTWILLHFWAMSNNAVHWKNAEQFRPERFLNEDGTFLKNDFLLAFSTGKLIFSN